MASSSEPLPAPDAVPSSSEAPEPAPDPKTPAKEKHADDGDACRICRSPGTPEEPLFYPCKCSGSIKFVHQECLMEWLSHTQKKHCELCKTPFRFTKLYDPHMPSTLPTAVFIRRAFIHILRHFVVWCRGLLVVAVWLIWLPWAMRYVWRGLFWLGDGGWTREIQMAALSSRAEPLSFANASSATLSSAMTNASDLTSALRALPSMLTPYSQTLNMSSTEPWPVSVIRRLLFGPGLRRLPSGAANQTISSSGSLILFPRHSSLLSDVPLINNLSSSPFMNGFVLDVLEGQIITLLVVVAFILIFLIREWVVQQQPALNVQAGNQGNQDNAAGPQPPAQAEEERAENAQVEEDDHNNDSGNDNEFVDANQEPGGAENVDNDDHSDEDEEQREQAPDPRQRILPEEAKSRVLELIDLLPADVRATLINGEVKEVVKLVDQMSQGDADSVKDRISRLSKVLPDAVSSESGEDDSNETPEDFLARLRATYSTSNDYDSQSTASSTLRRRPNMPDRDRSFMATEIRRSLEESGSHAEGSEARAGNAASDFDAHGHGGDTEDSSDTSNESWQRISESEGENQNDSRDKGKGKARADEIPDESAEKVFTSAYASEYTAKFSHQAISKIYDEETRAGSLDNPFHPDYQGEFFDGPTDRPVPWNEANTEPGQDRGETPQIRRVEVNAVRPGVIDRVLDWIWGDIAPVDENDNPDQDEERVVQDLAAEAPFVHVGQADQHPERDNAPQAEPEEPVQDGDVAAAAAEAGIDVNDQEAVDDAEDLEGILELIGMQGPLTGLFQNALFSAVLITATVTVAVWAPYLWGKVVLLFMGNPAAFALKVPLRIISAAADLVSDFVLFLGGSLIYWAGLLEKFVCSNLAYFTHINANVLFKESLTKSAGDIAQRALQRVMAFFVATTSYHDSDFLFLSLDSHAALRSVQNQASHIMSVLGSSVISGFQLASSKSPTQAWSTLLRHGWPFLCQIASRAKGAAVIFGELMSDAKSFNISLTIDIQQTTFDPSLAYWSASDRAIAVLAGYLCFAALGALYLKYAMPLTNSEHEGLAVDFLTQAGGILKVVLIISIEMIVFPLYCGMLLDIALLPLFENCSILSRINFTIESPWTSGFVHWFLGTCYMFHFALFVSMCRKIMRSGVLYFIRDPDDPTFHPVRDVLERNVTTQLRKIAFSALVYGALVIVCLGSVVWGLYYGCSGVLPIHWSSSRPALGFPLDLLFYSFVTPLVIQYFKPSDGLHALYEWWFQRCARFLRLSNFMFGEKNKDELGHHVRRTWRAWLTGAKGDVDCPYFPGESRASRDDGELQVDKNEPDVYFVRDGRMVWAPGSDQVRIPRGTAVFQDMTETDTDEWLKDEDNKGRVQGIGRVSMVHIPPHFRLRISLFVLAIWLFAAATGVGVTIVPMSFGRRVLSAFLHPTVRINDIYAFTLGIYTLGGLLYVALHLRNVFLTLRTTPSSSNIRPSSALLRHWLKTAFSFTLRIARLLYLYTFLGLVFPLLFASVLEAYVLLPLHTYIAPADRHTIHLIQDWTLGVLYVRIGYRIASWNPDSRPARALAGILANGYTDPNVWLATRYFIMPGLILAGIALVAPLVVAGLATGFWFGNGEMNDELKVRVWRFAYPFCASVVGSLWGVGALIEATGRWRRRIRDEVYLIGERLHNFGERKGVVPHGEMGTA